MMSGQSITTLIYKFNCQSAIISLKNLLQSLQASDLRIYIWNTSGSDIAVCLPKNVEVITTKTEFLNDFNELKKILVGTEETSGVMLCNSSVLLNSNDVRHLHAKYEEYSGCVLCTEGIRLYPHTPIRDGDYFLSDHLNSWRFYDHGITDRQVHLITFISGIIVISKKLLSKAIESIENSLMYKQWYDNDLVNSPEFVYSIVANENLCTPIWKIQIDLNLLPNVNILSTLMNSPDLAWLLCTLENYSWPRYFIQPFLPDASMEKGDTAPKSLWERGFAGFNVSTQSSMLDLAACRYYGASVVRYGAVNDASDLSFMVIDDDTDNNNVRMFRHIDENIAKLRKAISNAASLHLKVIITFTDLPGRESKVTDFRLFSDRNFRSKFANFWKKIANSVLDFRYHIAGYDLINEPYLPGDVSKSFYCNMEDPFVTNLQELYSEAIKAIRTVDKSTKIILESSFWASPRSLKYILPLEDKDIVYSFHFYCPYIYTNRLHNSGQFKYPGNIPYWENVTYEDCVPFWDINKLEEMLKEVVDWQIKYSVSSKNVFVGEFGICREVPGAERYLTDLLNIWSKYDWSWCIFSFRDDDWDAMDYELGSSIQNQLEWEQSNLIKLISKHMILKNSTHQP